MHLYNVSLETTGAITQSIVGHFTGTKSQEICIARNSLLELISVDPNTGRLLTICKVNIFGLVRSMQPFRSSGTMLDYIILGTDSGRIVVLQYNKEKNNFDQIHRETFGKSGSRRVVPGQLLACDPMGRACMIGAVERSKLVYVLNRDSENKLTISSPLESNKSLNFCFEMVGMDVGFENPCFACIEVDCSESDQDSTGKAFKEIEKMLVLYELDLGLNHVVRKYAEPVERTAHHLVPLPSKDAPSGVLVCSHDLITWMHPDYEKVSVPIPKRPHDSDPVMIVTSVVHKLKKGHFFCLLQTELGDIFKVTLEYTRKTDGAVGQVSSINIKFFDTVPVANSLLLLKAGFLFIPAEFGNHILYQIENLGDDEEDQPEFSSTDFDQENIPSVEFKPRSLRNLSPVDEIDSLCPLIDSKVVDLLDQDTPQIYALCGRGSRSTFRILRHGLSVSELAASDLPGNPNAVWTIKTSPDDEFDSYIVISFLNGTLILSIGDSVEEVTDTGFLTTTATLAVGLLQDSLVQVHSLGIRQIRPDKRVSEWRTPKGTRNICASCNERQVVVALDDGKVIYFELDNHGNLNEYQHHKQFTSSVVSLALSPIPEGRQRSSFLAVGCSDLTVRLLSLDPSNCLEGKSMQALSATAISLAIIEMIDTTTGISSLYLNMGLSNGVLLRSTVDTITGELSDSRTRYLGAQGTKLVTIKINGAYGMLALSTKPWLAFSYNGRYRLVPLSYEQLEFGYNFCSEACREGMVAISGNSLRILALERLDKEFNQVSIPLTYTPRRFLLDEETRCFLIIESDHRTFCKSERKNIDLDPVQFGHPRAPKGKWASLLRLLDPMTGKSRDLIDFDNNEAAISIAKGTFLSHPREILYIVGSVSNLDQKTKKCSGAISVYKIENFKLTLLQKTLIESAPYALCPFQGKLLVGMGKTLRLYEIGKKKLLRKCEMSRFAVNIVKLETQGNRIIATDSQEGVHYCMYRHYDNQIVIFADDPMPRWSTCSTMLDYDTVCGGDKFGNLWIVRLDEALSREMDEDMTGSLSIFERGYLNAAPNKLTNLCNFHQSESITSVQKCVLVPGGKSCLLYTTILGTIGCLIPFKTKNDYESLQLMEISLRQEQPPLSGRDHFQFRSVYKPVQNVIDGDYCESFNQLPNVTKRQIASQLDKTSLEIAKKLEDIRTRSAF